MRLGIGLPAAVPDADMTLLGRWAVEAERGGFESVGVIDRLVYDNLDPLTALAAAAATTSRIGLTSTVVNVCWRNNPVLLAKQLSSVARLSGGRDGQPRITCPRGLTSPDHLLAELGRLSQAGCDEVVLFPCSGALVQIALLSDALQGAAKTCA